MKAFSFLMSIYLLTLCCIPCSDSDECKDSVKQEISSATDHSEHEHSEEACTPFCTCSCCAISVYCQSLFVMDLSNEVIPFAQVNDYQDYFIKEIAISIWQPPKIA